MIKVKLQSLKHEHKFWQNFNNTVDPMSTGGLEPKTAIHYLLHCNLYSTKILDLLNNVYILNTSLKITPIKSLQIFFYMNQKVLIVM